MNPIHHSAKLFPSEKAVVENFKAFVDLIKTRLRDADFVPALAALEIASSLKGESVRRDGFTPSILHELTLGRWLIGLDDADKLNMSGREKMILFSVAFLHDMGEDYGAAICGFRRNQVRDESLSAEDIRGAFKRGLTEMIRSRTPIQDEAASERIAELAWRMTKSYDDGDTKIPLYPTTSAYLARLAEDPLTAIVKIQDRLHNLATLIGATDRDRLLRYLKETREEYPKLSQNACARHPEHRKTIHFLSGVQRKQIAVTERALGLAAPLKQEFNRHADAGFHTIETGVNPILMIVSRAVEQARPENGPAFVSKEPGKVME